MRSGKWAWILLAVLPLLPGCADFWVSPSDGGSSGGCTTNCTTLSSGNFYILSNSGTPQIVGESIASGKLTGISGSPWNLGMPSYSMAISPNGANLYVSTTAGVIMYPVSNGSLGTAAQVSQDPTAFAIAVDTSGNWLIEAQQGTGGVIMGAVPLNSSGSNAGAEITASYTVANAAIPNGKIAISSDDTYIFVSLGNGGTIAVPFNANAGSGNNPFGSTANVIPTVSSAGQSVSVAVDPNHRLFYIGETLANSTNTSGALRAFLYSSLGGTAVTEISGSPIDSGGLAPNAILPLSSYVYVASGKGASTTGSIVSFAVTSSGSSFSLASGSIVAAGAQPLSLAQDKTDNFVLAVNSSGNPYFSSYTFNTTPGKLDVQVTSGSPSSPIAIVAAP